MLLDKVSKAGLPADHVEWIDCDMSSMESVRSFGKKILEKNVSISLLINNGNCIQATHSSFSINIIPVSFSWHHVY